MTPAIRTEDQARKKIGRQMVATSWRVQGRTEIELASSCGAANRELRLAPKCCFGVQGQAVGGLEAKKAIKNAEGILLGTPIESLSFLDLGTGDKAQFVNLLDPHSHSRRIFSAHQSGTAAEWLQGDSIPRWNAKAISSIPSASRACGQTRCTGGIGPKPFRAG